MNANAALIAKTRSGTQQSVRALLDLVSRDGDPLLVWSNDPWPYLNLDRVAATRFFYKRFLLGEIYLGRTSRAYVLPQTWRWFAQDLRRSDPVAYLRADQPNLPSGTPFRTYVERNFDLVFPDPDLPVSLRHDVAQQVIGGTATRDWIGRAPTVSRTGWKVENGIARYAKGPVSRSDDQLTLSTSSCFRLDGDIRADDTGNLGRVRFHFDDNEGKSQQLNLSFEGADAASSNNFADILRKPTNVPAGAHRVPFSVVVGRRSAALVIVHQVVAAVSLPSSVTVTAEARSPSVELAHLRVGSAPTGSGC